MKPIILILIIHVISVRSGEPNWSPIGNPLITAFPCFPSKDIVTWFDPSLPPKEKARYYVYINKVMPEDSKLRMSFNAETSVTINFRTEPKKFVRFNFPKGEHFLFRFYAEMHGIGFIVKGVVPGIVPYFTSISMDSEELCYRPYVDYLEPYLTDDIVLETENSSQTQNCGVSKVKPKNKKRKDATRPGEWPWHTALYRYDGTESNYLCGGTLISKYFVLTAAHCVTLNGVPLLPEVLIAILGMYNLHQNDIRLQPKEISSVIVHERFVYRFLYSDISLLKLATEAIFTRYVQPACLWSSKVSEKFKDSDQINGTVIGWGLNGTANLKKRLKQIQMPMVTQSTCVKSSNAYTEIVIDATNFCAGDRKGKSACNGDSGSAYQVLVDGAWYVRGIVSLMASKRDKPVCDPTQYVVFTDLKTFRIWIDAYLDNEDY